MGIVIRQGIKQSVVTYLGVLIGAINVLFIYPLTLSKEELGLLRFVIDTGTLVMPFMLVGANQVSLKFFPYFRTEKSNRHNGLLAFLILFVLISSSIVCLVFYFFKEPIYQFYANQSSEFEPTLKFILPLGFLFALFILFYGYAQNFKRIAIPSAFNTLYIKIGLPALAIAYYFNVISLLQIFYGVLIIYLVINISHFIYLKSLKQWSLNTDFKKYLTFTKFKEVLEFSLYATIGNLGSVIVIRIDSFMVASIASLADNGVYTISAFIANAIATPTGAINAIATPLVSEFWKTNNLKEIKVLYQKSSLNLMIVGCWLFACIAIGLTYLFEIMPKGEDYAVGTGVILVLGASKLIDMATSINNPIIAMSKHYKFNFYSLIFLAVLNVAGNWFLIADYGILGAAVASFISLFIFNILKLGFIWWKFNMQPFTKESIFVLGFILIAFLVAYFLPETTTPLINLIIKCGTITLIFWILVFVTSISKDLNNLLLKIMDKLPVKR